MMHCSMLQSVPWHATLTSGLPRPSYDGHCDRNFPYILSSCVSPGEDNQKQAQATATPLAYCRAARQPAATASASVQNQRSPDAASTCEAPRLVKAFSLTIHRSRAL